jgi:tetratricopeptide (TPR) repeat protein
MSARLRGAAQAGIALAFAAPWIVARPLQALSLLLLLPWFGGFLLLRRRRSGEDPAQGTVLFLAAASCLIAGLAPVLTAGPADSALVIALCAALLLLLPWNLAAGRPLEALLLCVLLVLTPPLQIEKWQALSPVHALLLLGLTLPGSGKRPRARTLSALVGGFLGVTLISTLGSAYPQASLRAWCWLVVGAVLLHLVSELPREARNRLALVPVAVGTGIAGGAIYRVAERCLVLGVQEGLSFRIWVADSPPNYTAFYGMVALPLTIELLRRVHTRAARIAAAVSTVLLVLYLLLSYARITWASLILIAAVLVAVAGTDLLRRLLRRPRRLAALLLAAALLLGIGWRFAPKTVHDRFHFMLHPFSDERFAVWRATLAMVRDRPFLGSGLAMKRFLFPMYKARFEPYRKITAQYLVDAHSMYIELVSATGIVGLLAFLLLVVGAALPRGRLKSATPAAERRRYATFLAALAAFLLDGAVNFRLLLPDDGHLFWFLLAWGAWPAFRLQGRERTALAGGGEQHRPPSPAPSPTDRPSAPDRRGGPSSGVTDRPGARLPALLAGIAAACLLSLLADQHALRARDEARRVISESRGAPERAAESRRWFQLSAWLAPLDAHARFMLATWEQNFGRPERALELLDRALELNPVSALYHHSRGMLRLALRQVEPCLRDLDAAITLWPYQNDGQYHFDRARVRALVGDGDGAAQDLTEALRMNPQLVRRPFWSSLPDQTRQSILAALRDRAAAATRDDPPLGRILTLRLIELLQALEEPAKALAELDSFAGTAGWDTDLILRKVRLLKQLDRSDEARALVDRWLVMDPRHAMLRNEAGILAFQQGDLERAAHMFRKAIALWSSITLDNYVAHRYLLEIARRTGDAAEAARQERIVRFLEPRLRHQLWEADFHFAGEYEELQQTLLYASQVK